MKVPYTFTYIVALEAPKIILTFELITYNIYGH